jgi:tetratricopeptide (TPR) repeat protein
MKLTIDDALKKGIEAHKLQQIQEADKFYTAILQAQPKHPDANHNMGVLAVGVGKVQEALPFFKTALEARSSIAQYWLSYIDALIKLGQISDAKAVFSQAKSKGASGETFDQMGTELSKLSTYPQNPPSDLLQPIINLYTEGQLQQALSESTQMLERFPSSIVLYNIAGASNAGLIQFDAAIDSYKQALKIKPDYAQAYSNMANALRDKGDLDASIDSCKQALKIKPDYAEAYNNMGNALKAKGDLDASIDSYKQALKIKPDIAEAYYNLGNTLEELGRLDEAETSYTQAIALEPDLESAAQNMVKLPVGQLDLKILALLDKALLVQSQSVKNQASYYFFKANLLKHKGLMEQSFGEFCKANKLRWEEVREQYSTYDRACTGNLNRIRQWAPNAPELVENGLTKLFLVGPSRSGKSSLEHALSRSSQVKPLYEGIRYSGLSKDVVNGKDPYETLYEKHFFQSEDEFLHQGYKVVTSTDPDSIFYSDYLIDMLPNTFFLIIKRNSRDLASEIFTTEYTNGNFYSYHPNGISKYLCVYNKICEALALKVPDRCITINFEDIMNSPEDTVERIGDLVCRNLEVSRLKKYVTSFTSESLFRNHFEDINQSTKY